MRREEEVVEIDKAKGLDKRKYNKGRIKGQWIFNGTQRSTKRLFIEPVSARAADVI